MGSGGLIINLSGFVGATSGPGIGMVSGSYIQKIGVGVSGGIYVFPDTTIRLTTLSGVGIRNSSGQYPISGFF